VSGGSGEDSPESEFGEVCTDADGALVFEFAPEAFSGAVSQGGINVAYGVPCGLVELYRAGDSVAEQQGAFLAGRDHHADMTGSVPRREQRSHAGRNDGVVVNGLQAGGMAGHAESLPDVDSHLAGPADEVVPVGGAEPDSGLREDRAGVEVEEPSDVVGVQVAADDVGYLGGGHAEGAQAGGKLAAGEVHAVRQFLQFRSEASVDEHESAAGADQEAADRKPGRVVAVE
jgi:hypothetical protein